MKINKIIILFYLILSQIVAYSQTNLNDGLIAYYPFDGNVLDESGNDLNGKVIGNAIWSVDRFGNDKSAFKFDGTTYVDVENDDLLNLQNLTLSVWFYNENNKMINPILFKGRYNGNTKLPLNQRQYQFFSSHYKKELNKKENITFQIFNHRNKWQFTDIPISVKANTWNHLAATYGSNVARIYLNGKLIKEHKFEGKIFIPKDSKSMTIGGTISDNNAHYGNLIRYRTGMLDELKIFDRALSSLEINQLHSGKKERKIKVKEIIEVKKSNIILKVWDNGQVDNDTISIKLNDEWLIKNHRIDEDKFEIPFTVESKNNYLIMYAENLGDIEPNTAAMSIIVDGKERILNLSSDFKNSEAIEIIYIE